MLRAMIVLAAASAAYGVSIGLFHSLDYALRNAIKFPLLLLGTTAVCSIAYFLCARLLGAPLGFIRTQRLTVEIYRGTSVLLASLASVNLFLILTVEQPRSGDDLAGYPLFLGFNVVLIAVSGSTALLHQGALLIRDRHLSKAKGITLLAVWLALSLPVGGQWAWYLRPFFGISALPSLESFCLGNRPDWRGDRNFFEAVYHIVIPPEPRR